MRRRVGSSASRGVCRRAFAGHVFLLAVDPDSEASFAILPRQRVKLFLVICGMRLCIAVAARRCGATNDDCRAQSPGSLTTVRACSRDSSAACCCEWSLQRRRGALLFRVYGSGPEPAFFPQPVVVEGTHAGCAPDPNGRCGVEYGTSDENHVADGGTLVRGWTKPILGSPPAFGPFDSTPATFVGRIKLRKNAEGHGEKTPQHEARREAGKKHSRNLHHQDSNSRHDTQQ
ncbi:hypothetical protein ISCGN_023600 [Ixodes scapularis]